MGEQTERGIVLSDIHFDNADERAVALALRFSKHYNPHRIFLDGDVVDSWAISRHAKHPGKSQSYLQDITRTRRFLADLRRLHPKAQIDFIDGNHDKVRLDAYMGNNAPELYPFVSFSELLDLERHDINYHASLHRENWIKYKDLYIGHFDRAAGNAASTAQALLRERGVSLIQGHVHKAGMTAKTFLDRTLYAYENPCLASLNQDYIRSPNWQQGFTLIESYKGTTWVYIIVMKDYRFVWNGRVWRG